MVQTRSRNYEANDVVRERAEAVQKARIERSYLNSIWLFLKLCYYRIYYTLFYDTRIVNHEIVQQFKDL